jgi:hypothetical protein
LLCVFIFRLFLDEVVISPTVTDVNVAKNAVIAYSVSQCAKEVGVRMAVGAAARDIQDLIFYEACGP